MAKVKRKVLRQMLRDAEARRRAAEEERDLVRGGIVDANVTVVRLSHDLAAMDDDRRSALAQLASVNARMRTILRAAGGGQRKTCDPVRVRALLRDWLDA